MSAKHPMGCSQHHYCPHYVELLHGKPDHDDDKRDGMTQLSDGAIVEAYLTGQFNVTPFDSDMIQPASIDMRLDRFFRQFKKKNKIIDPSKPIDDMMELFTLPPVGVSFTLLPGEFALATTHERVELSAALAGRFEGKSSLGRIGLTTHSTAGFIDPGFRGPITLELYNMSPHMIVLWPGMKIGQLCLTRLSEPALHPYGEGKNASRYQDQEGPTPSRSYINFKSWSHR